MDDNLDKELYQNLSDYLKDLAALNDLKDSAPAEYRLDDHQNIVVRTRGSLEVICGPMFSGKSEELMRRLRRAMFAVSDKSVVIAFKHGLDTRYGASELLSHDGNKFRAIPTKCASTILSQSSSSHVVGIDEAQFFPEAIVPVVSALVKAGKKVIVAGLDLDFRGVEFGPMPSLLAIADSITKLSAVCAKCGHDAPLTQRLIDGQPAAFDDGIVHVGGKDEYQARCRLCHVLTKRSVLSERCDGTPEELLRF